MVLNATSEKKSYKDWLGKGHFAQRLLLALLLFFSIAFFLHFKQARIDHLHLDAISDRYIIGQVDFEFPDEEATEIIKQQSLRDIGAIYRLNDKQLKQIRFDFESYLLTEQKWRSELKKATFEDLYKTADALESLLIRARFSNQRTLRKLQNYHYPVDHYYLLNGVKAQEPAVLSQEIWAHLRGQLLLQEELFEEVVDFILSAFESQHLILVQDLSSERNLREFIYHQVPNQYTQVRAGTRIIEPGEKITARHLGMLQSMKEALAKERNLWAVNTIFSSLVIAFLFTFLGILYLRTYHREVIDSIQKTGLLLTIVILTLLLAKMTEWILVNSDQGLGDFFRYPIIVPFASILIFMLVSRQVALFISAFLTITLGISLAIDHERFLVVNLMSSWVAILLAGSMHKRKEIFLVLAKVWLACFPLILAFNLCQNISGQQLVQDLISSLLFIFANAVLLIGALPILESLFHALTEMSLMEYMDPSNELLQRLSAEAPGTYQHSLVVGNLAESAARSIGAHALLCRVASLYHDIGKLINPHYFTENQLGGFNIHQVMTASESAQVIIAHVSEGEVLANQYRLPQSFIDIIREHHGTTLAYFFYHKQQCTQVAKADEALFRYLGPKPKSKESALIMLADALEASSRSLEKVDEQSLETLVEQIVSERIADGQLEECQLTFEELKTAKKTMQQTLLLACHYRVKYPEKALTITAPNFS